MNGFGRGRATGRNRWASDHERACQRAAERLSLPLPAAEAAWLDRHLGRCSWCAAVADDYALHHEGLRALAEPLPPRDLWARTSAALDRAERQAGHGLPAASVFPGRGGQPASQGSRSIRGLRAERRASNFRASSRSAAARVRLERAGGGYSAGYGWAAPFGALAALAVVIVVGGTIMLTDSLTPSIASARPGSGVANSAVAAATPLAVGAGQVAWLSAGDDGTYSLNFAQVSQVCPATARPDCAPIPTNGARHLPTIRVTPHTVISSPSKSQLVVVDASAKGSGGSLYIVSIPAGVTVTPSSGQATAAATAVLASAKPLDSPSVPALAGGSPSAPASAPPTGSATPGLTAPAASPDPAGAPSASVAPTTPAAASPTVDVSATDSAAPVATASEPAASSAEPGASEFPGVSQPSEGESPEPAASGAATEPTPEPTASTLAIISDIVVVGETAAYSPDGTMLAFSARPADGSQGPDIYLWRLGDATAHAVTTDHASIFSGWLGNQLVGSRAVDANGRPASSAPAGSLDSGAQAPGADVPPASGSPAVDPASPAVDPASPAVDGTSPAPSAEPSPSSASRSSDARLTRPSLRAGAPVAGPTLPAPSGSPQPDESGSPASLLLPFLGFDLRGLGLAASSPGTGDAGSTNAGNGGANTEAAGNLRFAEPTFPAGPQAIPQSFVIDPVAEIETPLVAPAWRPVVDPTGRFVAYWAGTLRYDATTLTWVPNRGLLVIALWSALAATDPTAILAPVPLLASASDPVSGGDWDIRWDAIGSHIGLWTADADDPDVGRLSLLTIDPATARVDPSNALLQGVPALAGFSIGSDRIAWATPPGQDGEGSRVQVLAWNGANAGNIDSQPVSGGNAVVVVR